ncbi:hypothetical protein [Diaphorobacter sp. LR2014-1]|nr:hypothetical protein [Diaphorobacter sp. LR2014-1]
MKLMGIVFAVLVAITGFSAMANDSASPAVQKVQSRQAAIDAAVNAAQ